MLLISLSALFLPVTSLYFYLEGSDKRCFLEELPKDTLMTGKIRAEEYNSDQNAYVVNPQLGIQITVDETFDNDHRVVNQRAQSEGRFTFTAAESGEHRICFQTNAGGGWFTSSHVKLHLDLATGDTSSIDSKSDEKYKDLLQRISDLNSRLHDIRREQLFQRDREADFRNISENVNTRVIRWTVIQFLVLGATCAWQLSHLTTFFTKQKLV
ncbi:putative membrane protein [Neolecta irregularis DAH-3]|uniref:Putative membrane protein n=1 Tax=Neolecta irregularis (strain DAH-3) TaxID=1198029 RepID=A0A1U7LIF2_NEOID|nr:putative membrane protein [Neolecta irregularis DAH-3]|eukprot:OLL22424.1 putative membrane protein [Neolecta irregularis DAH-3]